MVSVDCAEGGFSAHILQREHANNACNGQRFCVACEHCLRAQRAVEGCSMMGACQSDRHATLAWMRLSSGAILFQV